MRTTVTNALKFDALKFEDAIASTPEPGVRRNTGRAALCGLSKSYNLQHVDCSPSAGKINMKLRNSHRYFDPVLHQNGGARILHDDTLASLHHMNDTGGTHGEVLLMQAGTSLS